MRRPVLKIAMTGHIDHGKSTVIGRILLETKSLPGDKIRELNRICREFGKETELAYLTDQLKEERERNITIDTTEIFVKTRRRDYYLIDTPGHLEFVKNMLTGASHADAAILVVDGQEGSREQTRRHAFLLSLLNIRQILVVVNKMDLLGYQPEAFQRIQDDLTAFLGGMNLTSLTFIPVSAKDNVNITGRSPLLRWYQGPHLLKAMDALADPSEAGNTSLRLPVQDIYRIDGEDIIVGRVASGRLRAGDTVSILPAGRTAKVTQIKAFNMQKKEAVCGESTGVICAPAGLAQRGDVLCSFEDAPAAVKAFTGSLFWLGSSPLQRGDTLTLRCGSREVPAAVVRLDQRTDPSTLAPLGDNARELKTHEAALVRVELQDPALVEPFALTPELGRYVLEQRGTLVGAGTITSVN